MSRLPSFLALRAFEAAARLESFALASAELHLTPSAISHQVRALESHFARPLFVRRQRHVEATPDGRRLQAELCRAFASIEAACAALEPTPHPQALAIHCAPSLASTWLGPRLPSFMRRHPSISIKLTASADRLDILHQADLDLLIAYGAPMRGTGLVSEPLGIERVTALCTPDIARLLGADDATALSRLTLIESAVSPVRWADWCALNALPIPTQRDRPSFDRGALAISAAVQGIGVALESTRFAHQELDRGALVELDARRFKAVPRPMHFLSYRQVLGDTPKIRAFRLWLTEQVDGDI